MANAWTQVDQIASEALMQMQDALVITNLTARDKTSDFNKTPDGYAVGSSVRIKTRPDFEAKEFASAIEVQDIRESQRTMTIEKHFDVSVQITAQEKRLDMDGFVEQVIQPAAMRLAEKCDQYVGTKILEGAGLYASNDLFATAADMALARQAGFVQQLDPTGRFCLVNDDLEADLLGATFFNTYNNRGDDGATVFQEANLGRAMGMNFFSSMNMPSDTHAAAGSGTSTTNNTGSTNLVGQSTLTIDSLTGQIEEGDHLQIAGVKRPLVASAQVTATGTSVPLVDPISEIIPDGAAVTVIGTGQSNLEFKGAIFDSQSLAVAMPMLDAPSDKPSFVVNHDGYSIRVVTGYDMTAKTETMSLDLLIGAKAYDPRRITLLREY